MQLLQQIQDLAGVGIDALREAMGQAGEAGAGRPGGGEGGPPAPGPEGGEEPPAGPPA